MDEVYVKVALIKTALTSRPKQSREKQMTANYTV